VENTATLDLNLDLLVDNGRIQVIISDLSGSAPIDVQRDVTIGANMAEINVDLDGVTPSPGDQFTILSYGGTKTGSFTLAAEDVGMWQIGETSGGSGTVYVEYIVPEPMALSLLALGALALVKRSR
jgi:hypothetical protein